MNGPLIEIDPETGDTLLVDETPLPPAEGMVGPHFVNMADNSPNSNMDLVAAYLTQALDQDAGTRAPMVEEAERMVDVLGVGTEAKPDDYGYENSDTSTHTLLALAHTRFMARTLAEMLPPDKVVRACSAVDLAQIEDVAQRQQFERIVAAASGRVERFYYDYLMHKLPGYVEGLDRTIWNTGLLGIGHRKIRVDPTRTSTPVSIDDVPVEDLLFSLEDAAFCSQRKTHLINMPASELARLMATGFYRSVDVAGSTGISMSPMTARRDRMLGIQHDYLSGNDTHTLAEVHAELFFEGDRHPAGLARPYVITIHQATQQVLSFRRNWRADDPDERRIQSFIHYVYHPGHRQGSGVGLGQLLGNTAQALTRGQRRAFDAAYLANHPAGFKHSSFTVRNDATRVRPGEFIDVDSPNARISDAIMLHPFKGPDPGLLTLLDSLDRQGKELGGVATMDIDRMFKSGIAAGPAMAAFDQSHEFDTAVHRRIYRAAETEYRLMHRMMRESFGSREVIFGEGERLQPGDLVMTQVKPAMRPGHATRQRRAIEAQAAYDIGKENPEFVDRRATIVNLFSALGVENPEEMMLPKQNEVQPADLVSEYGRVMKGEPIRAGVSQNHSAHIEAHLAQIQGLAGSSIPAQAGQMASVALSAHIAEHMAFQLAVDVAAALGIPVEAFQQGIPPEVESQIAPALAQAVVQIERMRATPGDADVRLQIEQIRAENKTAIEQMRMNAKIAEIAARSKDGREENQSDFQINREDNATALLIARMKTAQPRPITRPRAPTNNPQPRSDPRR